MMETYNWQTIIGRHLYPGAYDPQTPWSGDVWEARRAARLAAQKMMRDNPERARRMLKEYRSRRLLAALK